MAQLNIHHVQADITNYLDLLDDLLTGGAGEQTNILNNIQQETLKKITTYLLTNEDKWLNHTLWDSWQHHQATLLSVLNIVWNNCLINKNQNPQSVLNLSVTVWYIEVLYFMAPKVKAAKIKLVKHVKAAITDCNTTKLILINITPCTDIVSNSYYLW